MRKIVALASIAAAIAVGLLYLRRNRPTPAPTPTPTPAPVFSPIGPMPIPPGAAAPTAPPPAPGGPDPRMMELADERRVRITRFARQGGSADIEVQWTGDRTTNGTDYIEALYRAGIISNFDVIGDPPINIQYTTDGTRVFSATYRVALR